MRRYFLYIFIFLSLISVSFYYDSYNISDDEESIIEALNKIPNIEVQKSIYELIRIDSTNYYLCLTNLENNGIGMAYLKKGWNGKFNLYVYSRYDYPHYYAVNTNKGVYGLVIGRNLNYKINRISVDFNREIFIDENVSNEDFFVKHYKISDNIENPYGGNFRFFGYSNEELNLKDFVE